MNAGYSLVEVLVAMAVFSIAALGVATAAVTLTRAGHASERVTQATILAQEKLEEFRAAFEPLRDGEDTPRLGYTRRWQVAPDAPEIGVARIEVSVSWPDADQPVSLVTVVNR